MAYSTQNAMYAVLIDGEDVKISFKVGEYEDGYPLLSTVITTYRASDRGFLVKECVDADWLIGEVFYKLGMLCNRFMTALLRKNKIQSIEFVDPLNHMGVMRNNRHINIRRLIKELRYKTQSTVTK